MATVAGPSQLAAQARRLYVEGLTRNLAALVQAALEGSRSLMDKPCEHAVFMRRRDLLQELQKGAQAWHRGMVGGLRQALAQGATATRPAGLAGSGGVGGLALVDDDTIELEIVTSRLALAMMDRASWEFADLRSRVATLEGRGELEAQDLLRAHVLARIVFDAWRAAGIGLASWRELQAVLHEEFAHLVEECYHETNRWLIEQRVLPEVDLRPFIRRARTHPQAAPGWAAGSGAPALPSQFGAAAAPGFDPTTNEGFVRAGHGGVGEETRLMTRSAQLPRSGEHAEAVLLRLNRLVGRHLPSFGRTSAGAAGAAGAAATAVSPGLAQAIETAQAGLKRRFMATTQRAMQLTTPAMLEELHQRKQVLKRAAATPEERATIEIVALLFQSILTEDRIPAAVRVWFARLQMPVLRVAVSEPDFFATTDHPARRLIDRMGACVMGFDTSAQVGQALEREIKRIVQVVEAYPDTGRRVFRTVLTEFEKFLEQYFRDQNEATRKGVSLAQQVEQRETLAIQYTIELRRMLNEVPVQEGVRQFLFHVWADVLATAAVRWGAQGDATKRMKRAAADLIWSASAKVSREERAEVIRRLPPLLKQLREGMSAAGLDAARQDEQIQQLNNSLAAAFTARAAVIPDDRLRAMMERLETLEELLPDANNVEIDESMVVDLSGQQSEDLEIVLDGGSMPTPAMLAWARELQVGSWFMLEHKGRQEPVQLAWQGLRKQLSLFVTPQGRCMLFQQQRLASFLQAGLLLPAQDEALTVRATRSALAKLDVDASRLLN
ncbi:MAG: hypothetical protein ABS84_02640 [Rubrivivax sp. SCN 71-131]|jgi:hypothetical protein|nr:MAG: hypothetical protein ABS84_02640 [Rubrivivax sp. SCN 71-131]